MTAQLPQPADGGGQLRVGRDHRRQPAPDPAGLLASVDLDARDRAPLSLRPVVQAHERRNREQQRPDRADQHRDPDVHAIVPGDAEPAHIGLDEAEVDDQQHHNPAEVAHPPAEPGHPPDIGLAGDIVQQRVVVHPGDLVDDRSEAQQSQAQPQVRRIRADEEEQRGDQRQRPGQSAQHGDGASAAVDGLSEHRSRQCHHQTGDRRRHRQGLRGLVGVAERRTGQVDREDEGDDDGVEGLSAPVPHRPADDLFRRRVLGPAERGCGFARDRWHGHASIRSSSSW
ncbi:hypothetical protein SDC9_123363 [bioreactor metagenome]|uniref:Uncharacterized protein n=1 Tax=bioreactor metagenome TaxID=1076179 RepID=A0A645CHF4_9ZZZZ